MLAMSSALYACIKENPMYGINLSNPNRNLYTDGMIFSPAVPVFRNDENNYELLPKPYSVCMITAAAPNTRVLIGVS